MEDIRAGVPLRGRLPRYRRVLDTSLIALAILRAGADRMDTETSGERWSLERWILMATPDGK
jgi:hypothetical protein